MFVIPCKYTTISNGVIELVKQIRHFHPNEKIVVVDSSSDDKSYFNELNKYNVIIEDVANKHYMVGAYWHGYNKYPEEDYYFMLHDSMFCKANLDYLKSRDLFTLCHFPRTASASFNAWNDRARNETTINKNYIKTDGKGCYGPMWGCKNWVMKKLFEQGVTILLPSSKGETGYCEGLYGLFFESLGFDLIQCALYGDILQLESPGGASGPYPHNTSHFTPLEKYYNSLRDPSRI